MQVPCYHTNHPYMINVLPALFSDCPVHRDQPNFDMLHTPECIQQFHEQCAEVFHTDECIEMKQEPEEEPEKRSWFWPVFIPVAIVCVIGTFAAGFIPSFIDYQNSKSKFTILGFIL